MQPLIWDVYFTNVIEFVNILIALGKCLGNCGIERAFASAQNPLRDTR